MSYREPFRSQARPQAPPQQQQQKLPAFEVIDLRPVQTGNLLAFLSLRIGKGPNEITVHSWRLIQQPGQAPWLSPPQESWEEEGRRKYKNLFDYPKAWRQALTDAAVSAWEERQREGGPQ